MTTSALPTNEDRSQPAVIRHVGRYRISVFEAIERLPSMRERGRRSIKRLLANLCAAGELESAPLYGNRVYYYLDRSSRPKDADQVDLPSRSLSEAAKIRAYAMLAFCCLTGAARQRLTPSEFRESFPETWRPRTSTSYYLDASGEPLRMGYLLVDGSGRGRWDRVLARLLRDVERHVRDAAWRPLIDRQAFEVTLVTALPQKAERLQDALAAWPAHYRDVARVHVLPELLNLIAPLPTQRSFF